MKELVVLILVFAISGCATQSFIINPNKTDKPIPITVMEKRDVFYFGGGLQSSSIDVGYTCYRDITRVAKVEAELTSTDMFISIVTLGIVTPRISRIYCYN